MCMQAAIRNIFLIVSHSQKVNNWKPPIQGSHGLNAKTLAQWSHPQPGQGLEVQAVARRGPSRSLLSNSSSSVTSDENDRPGNPSCRKDTHLRKDVNWLTSERSRAGCPFRLVWVVLVQKERSQVCHTRFLCKTWTPGTPKPPKCTELLPRGLRKQRPALPSVVEQGFLALLYDSHAQSNDSMDCSLRRTWERWPGGRPASLK